MKIFFKLLTIGVLFSSCNSSTNTEEKPAEETPSIGGQKDEHGCLPAAGQSWSELKSNCIQLFNEGTRLNPLTTKSGEAIFSAFVVYNDDKSKIEVFLPPKADDDDNEIESEILDLKGNHYEDDDLKYVPSEGTLYIKNVAIYKAEEIK